MNFKFDYLKEEVNGLVNKMTELVENMKEILYLMDDRSLFENNEDISLEDIKLYIQSLVEGQRGSLSRTIAGSWSVAPDDNGMDSDARVDFIFTPTYIATATICRFLLDYPNHVDHLNQVLSTLRLGMEFCSKRNLRGHGYEMDERLIDAFYTLSLGRVPEYLNRNPKFCPSLKMTIDNAANYMAKKIENNTAIGVWGEDYSQGFQGALETMYLLNHGIKKIIDENKQDPIRMKFEDFKK